MLQESSGDLLKKAKPRYFKEEFFSERENGRERGFFLGSLGRSFFCQEEKREKKEKKNLRGGEEEKEERRGSFSGRKLRRSFWLLEKSFR